MTLFAEPLTLRPYQTRAIELVIEAVGNGSRRPLLALPTGAGKTVIAAEIIRRHIERGGQALLLAPRRELITQASDKLTAAGLDHGVVLAGARDRVNLYARVQVASIDTVVSRLRRHGKLPVELQGMTLVIIDEGHLAVTVRRQDLLRQWPRAIHIGLTATPTRKDGRALGVLFDRLVEPVTVAELTEAGYLAPARYFSVSEPDLARITTVAGDYNSKQLDEAVNRPELVGDVVGTWLARAADRRTIVFGTSVEHSIALTGAFLRAGVAAEHVDGGMRPDVRTGIIERYRRGDTQVLCNCFIASFGFDAPETSAIVLARPTKSLMLHLQMIGRGLRIAGDKTDCLVIDHAGNVHRHGFAADERAWTLDGERALKERSGGKGATSERKQLDCPECTAVFSGTRTCPECGFYLAPAGKLVEALDGELVEIGERLPVEDQDRAVFYAELRGLASMSGYRQGWAAHKFKERYGEFPAWAWNNMPEATPTLTTTRWVKSRAIAWAKERQRACS